MSNLTPFQNPIKTTVKGPWFVHFKYKSTLTDELWDAGQVTTELAVLSCSSNGKSTANPVCTAEALKGINSSR